MLATVSYKYKLLFFLCFHTQIWVESSNAENTQGNETEDHSDFQPEEIRSEKARLLESDGFTRSPRLCEFLSFLVEEELAGRGKRINGTYGRDQAFDPRTDPVVRTEAGRLRRALEHYYLADGSQNPPRIEIPKGGYRPAFQVVSKPDIADTEELPLEEDDPCAEAIPLPSGPVIAVLPCGPGLLRRWLHWGVDHCAHPEDYITRNFLFDDQIIKMMDGLKKAGL